MDSITQGLLEAGHDVRVLSIATHKHADRRGELTQDYLNATGFDSVFVDTRVRVLGAARSLIARDSYNITRFNSDAFREKLIATLRTGSYTIVQLETLPMLNYLADVRANSKGKIIYRAHNVEHEIWDRLAAGATGLKRRYLRLLASRLEEFERANINSCDAIAAITREDAAQLRAMGCTRPIFHVPFAIPLEQEPSGEPGNTFFHIGAMDWEPNIEAMKYLLKSIWPRIHEARPDAVLRLAGRKMPNDFRSGNGVVIDAEVPNAGAFMRENGILLAPLLSGGGMRIKIIEAMALSRPVVSTRVGFEGIPVVDGVHGAVAETAEQFVAAAIRFYDDAKLRQRTGGAARQMVMNRFSRSAVTEELVGLYRHVLGS